MSLLGSTIHNYPLPWLYIAVPHSTMALRDLTTFCNGSTWFYLALPDSTTIYNGSTWLYLTLFQLLCMAILHSTMTLLAQPDSTTLYHGSTWVYLAVLHYTIPLPCSTCLYYILPWLGYILPWLYMTLLNSTTFYHGSTWLYLRRVMVQWSRTTVKCTRVM